MRILNIAVLLLITSMAGAQYTSLNDLDILIGEWEGVGTGFGNEQSSIHSSFLFAMDSAYIEVQNESKFEPTEKKPEGEIHKDKGFISYDKNRSMIVFRQFHIEGYITQYVLVDSLSSDKILVFETEAIENFVPGGKARWTIKRTGDNQIETIFDVSFGESGYTCFGNNILTLVKE